MVAWVAASDQQKYGVGEYNFTSNAIAVVLEIPVGQNEYILFNIRFPAGSAPLLAIPM